MLKKKILSLFLAICMLVSLMPTFVFAEDNFVPPSPSNPGEMRFTCMNEAITGGSVYYKLDNTGDFIKASEEGNQYNPITLGSATSITIRLAVNDGYELDTVRGVKLSVNGGEAFSSTTENVAEFVSEQGYTFNLSELAGDRSVSESSFELEFGFGAKSPDPENPDPENPDPENPAHPGYEGDEVISNLTISGDADFYINDSKMFNVAGGDNVSDTAKYTHNSNNAHV